LDGKAGSGAFADKDAGTGKTVNISGLSIGGTDAGNYTFNTTASAVADITPLAITGSITIDNKVYDGNATATILARTLTGVIGLDDVSYTGGAATFDTKDVGTGKTVTGTSLSLAGSAAGNYTVNTTTSTTADITKAALTVSATGINKTYDGDTTAAVTLSDNRISGDVLTDSYTGASFADKNVGTGKTMSATGISISGTDAGNYTFNTTASSTVDITTKALTIIGTTASNKVYDGSTTATLDTTAAVLSGKVSGDTVTLDASSAVGVFSDKNVGIAKTITVSGLTTGGADAANYSLIQPATTADITTKELAVTGITADSKVYDGASTATLTTGSASLSGGVVGGDIVNLSTGSASGAFTDKNAGTGKAVNISGLLISGVDANNYSLTQPTTTADITHKDLTATATGVNKTYDATTDASVNLSSDKIASDDLTSDYTGATFVDKNVGSGKAVSVTGISISGADAGNYNLLNTTASTTANITAKELTVTGITAANKVYDGTTTATLDTTAAALSGKVNGDTVNLDTGSAAGVFADSSVGTAKTITVSGLTTGGADSGNYSLTQPTTTADITAVTTYVSNSQISNTAVIHPILPNAGNLGQYQFNTFNPPGGPVYFYHPLTPLDTSAFDSLQLGNDAYQFINGSISIIGHEGLLPMVGKK